MRLICESFAATIEKVDKDNHVLKGVKLIGLVSPGRKRRYKEDGLKKAAPLYEGAPINIGHAPRGSNPNPTDVLGQVRNVRFVEGQGNFGDIHLIPSHPMTPRMEYIAENMPNVLAMSHAAQGSAVMEGDVEVIEEILSVSSVDVVSKGGTTNGLFEGALVEGEIADRIALQERAERIWKINSTAWSLICEAFYGEGTPGERTDRINAVLKDWQSELGALNEEQDMQIKDLTLSLLREERKDLVEELGRGSAARIATLEEENKTLKAQLDALKTEKETATKLAERNQARAKLVEDAKLPATLVTEEFKALYEDATTSDDSFTRVLGERKKLAETLKPTARSSAKELREAAGRPANSQPKTIDEFASVVNGHGR